MSQLTREDLKGMSPDAITSARKAGRLDALLGRQVTAGQALDAIERGQAQEAAAQPASQPSAGQLTRESLAGMTADAIVQAKAEGRLDALLGRTVTTDQAPNSIDQSETREPGQTATNVNV
ncbi:hypothetical protein ACIRP3_36760 [Streptomyces sp. NPDC101209]|uniref:hypothetical protein n=1 Tax=Streptomyces sp. NPDC101209 TaxID=3366129 RepID=UPI00381EA8B5